MRHFVEAHRRADSRSGFTLLEVLIACGLLAIGLAGVAALLPAIGSQLQQASLEDRAAALLATARADFASRNLASTRVFGPGYRPAAFGVLARPDLLAAVNSPTRLVAEGEPAYTLRRTDWAGLPQVRSHAGEDSLMYSAGSSPPPSVKVRSNAIHEFRSETSWGALLTAADPTAPWPATNVSSPSQWASSLMAARLDIAIFRKPDPEFAILSGVTTASGGTMLQISADDIETPAIDSSRKADPTELRAALADVRKRFLPGCSYVLALPPDTMPSEFNSTPSNTKTGPAVLRNEFGQNMGLLRLVQPKKIGDRWFYLLTGTSDNGLALPHEQPPYSQPDPPPPALEPLFGRSDAPISDARGSRTKTVGPITITLPTALELQAIFTNSNPSGWPNDQGFWSATQTKTANQHLYWDFGANNVLASADTAPRYAIVEVAVTPTWYRVASSWDDTATATIRTIFADPAMHDFPRSDAGKLRLLCIEGAMALDSSFLMLE